MNFILHNIHTILEWILFLTVLFMTNFFRKNLYSDSWHEVISTGCAFQGD